MLLCRVFANRVIFGDEFDHVVDEFKSKWGVPQCFGAVDGCHVPICAPSEQHIDYYNWYSMIIQGLVDANYCFLDICIGWPGSVHDARVFVHSLVQKLHMDPWFPIKLVTISAVHVPLYMMHTLCRHGS